MTKKYAKLLAAVLVLAMAVTLMPVTTEAAAKRKVSLYVGGTTTLKAKAKATWKSSNKKVATVSKKGVVKAKKAGKTTITAKKGKKSWKWTVTVKNPYLNHKEVTLVKGRLVNLKLTGATIKKCTSNNTSVATVTNKGKVRSVGVGKAIISVKASNKKVYKCSVTVTGAARVNDTPENTSQASSTPAHSHSWEKTSSKYDVSGAGHRLITSYKCKTCGEEKEEWAKEVEPCNNVEVVLKEATCTEDGEKALKCTVCGTVCESTTIPNTGHDFEYEYKKQVTVKDDWDIHYDYNNEHGYENMGERTATCKTCGESFEEVGFDTGVELRDGSQAVVWGVWEKPATKFITDEINYYRGDQLDDETGEKYLALLESSEDLSKYALFHAAQNCARNNLDCVGQMGKGWVTQAGFAASAPVGEKINIISSFMKLGDSFLSEEIKYSGGAHFRYETENGEFMDTLVAVGDSENKPRITCEKVGHDEDYASICHRCGRNSDIYLNSENSPYVYPSTAGIVGIGNGSYNDHEGLSIEPGSFDINHDGICDGCGGPILLKAGAGSWNYCNLALFGYGGMDFNNCVTIDNKYYFDQPNWREKLESYIANGKRIEAESNQ